MPRHGYIDFRILEPIGSHINAVQIFSKFGISIPRYV